LLVFGAFILPYLELGFAVEALLLAVLIAPVAFTLAVRFYKAQGGEDDIQAQLNRRDVLRTGWKDTGVTGFAFLLSGFIYAALVPESHEAVIDLVPNLASGLVFGILLGVVAGLALIFLRRRLVSYLRRRHHQEQYDLLIDGSLNTIRGGVESLLTQFHGTSLAMVLAILAAALPYTTAPQARTLPLLMFVPVASALLAASMVRDPAPNEPGVWHHLRKGASNVAQVGFGYVVGAVMLAPLELVHAWILDQPETVNEALLTHLDLTFAALAYSLFLGLLGGILSSRMSLLRVILTNLGNLGRTIPSLAVLALALPVFSALNDLVENSQAIRDFLHLFSVEEIEAIGRNPSLVALVFIGTLPILVNTTVGIVEVSSDVKEAARGMGMNGLQVLTRVEVPVAMPVIMAGIRTSAVLIVASATLATFIGGKGLGDLITTGDSINRDDILFTGAMLATILSIFLEYFFGWLEMLLTPRGLRET
jgi:osmoprotectant transport system permease protein